MVFMPNITTNNAITYTNYSFKIFLRFWLAEIPRIIHHNHLLSTKFGRKLMTSIVQQNCLGIERLTEKTWGRGWVVLVVNKKIGWKFHSFQELLAKNIARTAIRRLDERHLLLGELAELNIPLPLKIADKHALSKMKVMRWRWKLAFLACF